jgi:hypothetical protein
MLFLTALQSTINILFVVQALVLSLDHKKFFVMPDIQAINRVGKAFAKRQIINGIHQIGFASSIVPDKTV